MVPATYIAKKLVSKNAVPQGTANPKLKQDKLAKAATYIGLGALGLAATYFVGKKIVQKYRKNRSERNFSTETQQALLIRTALNPIGINWLAWMDGTKEESLYNIAYQIKDFRKVQTEYRNLFNRSLVQDLENELKTDEYQKFMNIINSGGYVPSVDDSSNMQQGNTSVPGTDNQIKGKVILIEKKTKVYEKFTWYPLGGVVKKIEPGYFINHLANGNVKNIPLGYGRYAEFIETVIKTAEGSVKKIYVDKADVRLVSKEQFNAGLKNQYTKVIFRDSDF